MNKSFLFFFFISISHAFIYCAGSLATSATVGSMKKTDDEQSTLTKTLNKNNQNNPGHISDVLQEDDQKKKNVRSLHASALINIAKASVEGAKITCAAGVEGLTFGYEAISDSNEKLKHMMQQREVIELMLRERRYLKPRVYEYIVPMSSKMLKEAHSPMSFEMLKEANLFETAAELEKHNMKVLRFIKATEKIDDFTDKLDEIAIENMAEFKNGILYGVPKAALKGGIVCAGDLALSQYVLDNKYARIVYRQSLTGLLNVQGNNTQERLQYAVTSLPHAVLKKCVVESAATAITDCIVDEVEKKVDSYLPEVSYNPEGGNTRYYLVTYGKPVVKETTRLALNYLLATKVVDPMYNKAASIINPGSSS